MSIEATLARVGLIRQDLANPAALINQDTAVTGGTEAPVSTSAPATSGASFASALAQASNPYPVMPAASNTPGGHVVAAAETQTGPD